MYDIKNQRFVIGEELTLEEVEKFAIQSRSFRDKSHRDTFSRDELLLMKYCYAIKNALFYMPTTECSSLSRDNSKSPEELKAMVDMFAYLLNRESLFQLDRDKNVQFEDTDLMRIGGYNQDIIEFALLQAGRRVVCDKYYYNDDLNAGRFDSSKYKTIPCTPVSVRELADSINEKIKASEEESEME